MKSRARFIDRASPTQSRALRAVGGPTSTHDTLSRTSVRGAPSTDAHRASGPTLWAIGGGKGGVGKSLISSSLAVCFARRGLRCAIVDADLGSANLHTLLGVGKPKATLSQFFAREVPDLADVLCETSIPNLLLVGDVDASSNAANPKHSQKRRLIRQLRTLDVDHVFLDLGAGCAYNVLDFFVAADHPILVAAPEPTSIENTYHFLKAAFYRWLGQVAKQGDVRAAIDQVLDENASTKLGSPRDLIAAVSAIHPIAGHTLRKRAESFAPQLIINKVRNSHHRGVGREISDTCREYLGAEVEYAGGVERDDCVFDAVSHCRPVLEIAPNSAFSRDVEVVADRLLQAFGTCPKRNSDPLQSATPVGIEVYQGRELASYGVLTDASRSAVGPVIPEVARHDGAKRTRTPEQPALPPLDDAKPGAHLRRCRETLGLGIHELSQATRIFSLHNIENECYDRLPPNPYLRGLVLQYAQALGIAEADILADAFVRRYQESPAAA